MESGFAAALVATLAVGFVECLGRFYPARPTWRRLRRARGRMAMIRMRERYETAAARGAPRFLALALLVLVVAWIASASLLDKRWYEVAIDVVPYAIVGLALLRMPPAMKAIAERMKDYEREAGDDSDARDEDWPDDVATL